MRVLKNISECQKKSKKRAEKRCKKTKTRDEEDSASWSRAERWVFRWAAENHLGNATTGQEDINRGDYQQRKKGFQVTWKKEAIVSVKQATGRKTKRKSIALRRDLFHAVPIRRYTIWYRKSDISKDSFVWNSKSKNEVVHMIWSQFSWKCGGEKLYHGERKSVTYNVAVYVYKDRYGIQ